MINTLLQAGHGPVRDLLIVRGYLIAFILLGVMVYLHYRTRVQFEEWVFHVYGSVTALFFLISTAILTYHWFIPGVVFSITLSLVLVGIGLAAGWTLWGNTEAFTKHSRRYYPSQTDGETSEQPPPEQTNTNSTNQTGKS